MTQRVSGRLHRLVGREGPLVTRRAFPLPFFPIITGVSDFDFYRLTGAHPIVVLNHQSDLMPTWTEGLAVGPCTGSNLTIDA